MLLLVDLDLDFLLILRDLDLLKLFDFDLDLTLVLDIDLALILLLDLDLDLILLLDIDLDLEMLLDLDLEGDALDLRETGLTLLDMGDLDFEGDLDLDTLDLRDLLDLLDAPEELDDELLLLLLEFELTDRFL